MALLRAEHLVKKYAGRTALDDVSITLKKGEIFGLLGPNGAGKTSLIRIVNQITAPDAGQILLEERPIQRSDIRHIGYLPEERGLYKKMKVKEQVLYFARLKGLRAAEAKRQLHRWSERLGMTDWHNKKADTLSKGMAQKVQFAITVLHQPKLLILDEPFSGFDPINAAAIKREIIALKEQGTSVLLSTHNMNSVEEICDSIALIDKAKLIMSGTLKAVKDRYRSNRYAIQFRGVPLNFAHALMADFALEHSEKLDEHTTLAHVKLLKKNTLNDLLRALLPAVEIAAVHELIPTMNDIFIAAVTGRDTGDSH